MKTKLFLATTLLFAVNVSSAFAYAQWVNYSAVYVNGNWYNCSSSWAENGSFNGKDLGYIASSSLSIGGNSNVKDENSANWNGGTVTMGYKIDGTDYSLSLAYKSWDGDNSTMQFESIGSIDISSLSVGEHTIEVWFSCDGKWDSNGGSNYKATFFTGPVVTLNSASGNYEPLYNSWNHGNPNPVNVVINNYTLYKDRDWNTLCLPFNLNGVQLGASPLKDVDIWKFNEESSSYDLETGSLVLNFVHQEGDNYKIEAGVPYLVRWNNHADPIVNPLFKGVQVAYYEPSYAEGVNGSVKFMGTYSYENFDYDIKYRYFLGAGNNLYYVGPGTEIYGFHAYFELLDGTAPEANVKSVVLNFGDEETSIKQINSTESATDTYYTIDGRHLNEKPATAGLYIINGKKVVIK